ncbi:MAG: hypothetical protein Greene071436_40, partial [Parcubacteria group bacterium Greene0714_36]
ARVRTNAGCVDEDMWRDVLMKLIKAH